MENIMAEVFKESAGGFGLKGDPHLWEDMKRYFSDIRHITCENDFHGELYDAFKKLTGRSAKSENFFYVDRYSRGGLTSGMIDPHSWDKVVFPILKLRFKNLRHSM